ncbi:hypothetical protein N0V90_013325 [Kalmusia sp. IMI 367209]|nr:hypothetical protein N0V90_013325 [Kalmusia sp. IMI 367209]
MADDDNFDIDIYGDDDAGQGFQEASAAPQEAAPTDTTTNADAQADPNTHTSSSKGGDGDVEIKDGDADATTNGEPHHENGTQQISSTGSSGNNQAFLKQAPQQQGVKRKQGADDDRPLDPGATAALLINELNWWISEEDIRGWANQGCCEDEINEVTFNEHKVNGKSKGQVYVQLQSPQAATALKHQIEALYPDQAHASAKRPTAIFNPPHVNPFKTLPKDVPQRDKNRGNQATGNFNNQGAQGGNFNRFNNQRGNFNNNNRGNMGFQNRNFSGGHMGGNMGNYGVPGAMNNFGMNNFGGNFNRGGMMGGMRGGMNNRGRGGMGMNNMGGMNMPMGNNMMGMGGGMGMMGNNMGMMGGAMGGAPGTFAANQAQFNPAFYNQNQAGGDGAWNPHGAKRPRPE